MTKLIGILMVVSLWSGCGGDSPTGDGKGKLLVWTTNYDDGSVKEEYQYYINPSNNRKVKHGWFNEYDGARELYEGGSYQDGKKVGEWIEKVYFCDTYYSLPGNTKLETFDFYYDRCVDAGETFYEDGVCVRGCIPD
jgi:hypothetical protein